MKKHHMLRTVLLSAVFALLTIVLLTPAASAHTSAHAHAAATSLAPASVPNVNIVIGHGKAVLVQRQSAVKRVAIKKTALPSPT